MIIRNKRNYIDTYSQSKVIKKRKSQYILKPTVEALELKKMVIIKAKTHFIKDMKLSVNPFEEH